MTKEGQRKPDELTAVIDALMEDMPIEKAYKVRDAVREEGRNLWKPVLLHLLALSAMMLLLCGLLVVGDYFEINAEPTNWDQFGTIAVFFPICAVLGYVVCHEVIFDKIKFRLRKILDDALEEYVKEKSTETGNKPI